MCPNISGTPSGKIASRVSRVARRSSASPARKTLPSFMKERVVDEVFDVGDEVGGHDEQRRGIELAQAPQRRGLPGSTPLTRREQACRAMMRGDLGFSPHALAHFAPGIARIGQAVEVSTMAAALVGVSRRKNREYSRRGRALFHSGLRSPRRGKETMDLETEPGWCPSMVTLPS